MATRQELSKKTYGENASGELLYLLTIGESKKAYTHELEKLRNLQKIIFFHNTRSLNSKKIVYQTNDGVVIQKDAVGFQR